MSELPVADEYARWLVSLKAEIQGARTRAVLSVNQELVRLYHRIGTEIVERRERQGWGAKVIERLSSDLRDAFPDMKGFSSRNLKYMSVFAEMCPGGQIGQQAAAQLPWFHLVTLLTKVSDPSEREWYATQTAQQGWSRATLEASIKSRLHLRQGAALTNFDRHLAAPHAQLAAEALKDPYHFDFLGLGDEAHEHDHTYKFSEGVEDGVVLDLVYEARDIEQTLGSQDKIDSWFDAKTRGLNDWQKAALREQWGTMQHVLSSRSRMDRVVSDIVYDFSVKPRLSEERGNAILVASSIYEACKYFELFQKTPFKGKCAVVTSYNPQPGDVSLEETGANTETDKQFLFNTYTALLQGVTAQPGKSKTEVYEDNAKRLFKEQPANMKLLVVVDKLLTGFDAPSCSYLYIDKRMQDHGLFQAICRVNRLDGDDKTVGYVVDYKDLFPRVEKAIAVYSAELDHSAGGVAPEVMLQDRLTKGRERLEAAFEALDLLCQPVAPPKGELEHIHYFCGNVEIPEDLAEHEPQRVALYKATVALVRAYAAIADDLEAAGYTPADVVRIKRDQQRYLDLREVIRHASSETIDLKAYEADMRHLLDTYINAAEPRKISPFGDIPLLELIVKSGIADAIRNLPSGIHKNRDAVAETIANNVRSKIIKEHLNDPAYYDRMSALLEEILADLKAKRVDYEEYLRRIAELAKQVQRGQAEDTPEALKSSSARRALYNNLAKPRVVNVKDAHIPAAKLANDARLALALAIDDTVKRVRPDDWRGHQARENEIKRALLPLLNNDPEEVERVFLIILQQREY